MLFNVSRQLNNRDIAKINYALEKYISPYEKKQKLFKNIELEKLGRSAGIVIAKHLEIEDQEELKSYHNLLNNHSKPIKRKISSDFIITRRENIVFPSLVKAEIDPNETVEHYLHMHVTRDSIMSNMLPGKINKDLEANGLEQIKQEDIIFFNDPTLLIQATTNEIMHNFDTLNNLASKISSYVGRISLSKLDLSSC